MTAENHSCLKCYILLYNQRYLVGNSNLPMRFCNKAKALFMLILAVNNVRRQSLRRWHDCRRGPQIGRPFVDLAPRWAFFISMAPLQCGTFTTKVRYRLYSTSKLINGCVNTKTSKKKLLNIKNCNNLEAKVSLDIRNQNLLSNE